MRCGVKRTDCVSHKRRSERTEAEQEEEKASEEAEEAEPLPAELAAMERGSAREPLLWNLDIELHCP